MKNDTTKTDGRSTVEDHSADAEPGVQAGETALRTDGGTTRRDTLRLIGALAALAGVPTGEVTADGAEDVRPRVGFERADPDRTHDVNVHVDLELPRDVAEQMPDRDSEHGRLRWLVDRFLFEYRLVVDGEVVETFEGFDPDVLGETFEDDGPEVRTDGGIPRRGALQAIGAFATAGYAGVGSADATAAVEDVDEYDVLPFTVPEGEACPFCQEGALERADDEALRCPECGEERPASWFATVTHREEFTHSVDIPVRVPEATLKAARDTPDADDPGRLYDALLNHVTHNFIWYGPDGERLPEFEDYYDGTY